MKNYRKIYLRCLSFILAVFLPVLSSGLTTEIYPLQTPQPAGLRLATFDIDVTPPLGYDIYGKPMVNSYDLGLRAKGIVLLGACRPIVLLAIDWIGIANECHDEFRQSLAIAAGTIPERVAVHALHQHDAVRADLQSDFVLAVIHRLETAVRNSLNNTQPITHIGLGEAQVYEIASNRRILGADGKVKVMRYTSENVPAIVALIHGEPEGLIDPMVSVVSFWNVDKPIAVLYFYATHPQSYYKLGIPCPDFPGIARFFRQLAVPDALHVYFTGAGGNIGAGKYNEYAKHENRGIFAERLADGMKRAWEASKREPVSAKNIAWTFEPVALPPDTVKRPNSVYEQRYKAGKKIDIGCLTLGRARILFMPGELFVEYQLAAKKMRPDLFVTMAAYGDGGTGYIPTAIAFKQGGYEPTASRVTPEAEGILMTAMSKLLKGKP